MRESAERFRKVAAGFTKRVDGVSPEGWDHQSPCPEWKARDVVGHVVDTAKMFLGRVGVPLDDVPSVEDDPPGAWQAARDAYQAALDDEAVATTEYDTQMGRMTLDDTMERFGTPDVLVHTWDLARATGQDDTLDPAEAERFFSMMEPMDEMMRQGTAFGDRVPVPADADPQTKLIAFTGRRP